MVWPPALSEDTPRLPPRTPQGYTHSSRTSTEGEGGGGAPHPIGRPTEKPQIHPKATPGTAKPPVSPWGPPAGDTPPLPAHPGRGHRAQPAPGTGAHEHGAAPPAPRGGLGHPQAHGPCGTGGVTPPAPRSPLSHASEPRLGSAAPSPRTGVKPRAELGSARS